MAAALALWAYCEASARFVFGEALGDPVADVILGLLKRRNAHRRHVERVSRSAFDADSRNRTLEAEKSISMEILAHFQILNNILKGTTKELENKGF